MNLFDTLPKTLVHGIPLTLNLTTRCFYLLFLACSLPYFHVTALKYLCGDLPQRNFNTFSDDWISWWEFPHSEASNCVFLPQPISSEPQDTYEKLQICEEKLYFLETKLEDFVYEDWMRGEQEKVKLYILNLCQQDLLIFGGRWGKWHKADAHKLGDWWGRRIVIASRRSWTADANVGASWCTLHPGEACPVAWSVALPLTTLAEQAKIQYTSCIVTKTS